MDDRLHIAKTEKEYMEGLKNPSKNIMYFPNANQMTMNGMKTPIKYYGITNGKITDEGYAKPGQKFNVNGVSTLEVRAPQMRHGGRMSFQDSGYASNKSARELLNDLLIAIQIDPDNASNAINHFRSLMRDYPADQLQAIVQPIIDNQSQFAPDEFTGILDDINVASTQGAQQPQTQPIQSTQPLVNTPTQPVTTPVTNQPVQTTPVTTPTVIDSNYTPQLYPKLTDPKYDPGKNYPGYTAPSDVFGQGKRYGSIRDGQARMREFLDETGTKYHLAGENRGVDNSYGSTTHGFITDPKMMQAFNEWESKKYPTQPTVTPTANTTTTPTANPNDRPFGTRTLNYTDNNWYMTPGGSKYRTSTQSGSGSGMNFQLPDGTVVNSTSIPPELIQQAKDNPISIPTQSPSSRFRDKANDAYGRLEEGFNSFKDRMNMDRSDRAMMKYYNYKDKAEQAAEIGNDRQAGKLLRKSQRQFERIAPLQAIQNANEARKNYNASIRRDEMKGNLSEKENRANERRVGAQARAERSPQLEQNETALNNYNTSARFANKREKQEGRDTRRNTSLNEEMLRAIEDAKTAKEKVENSQQYKTHRDQNIELNKTKGNKDKEKKKRWFNNKNHVDWMKSVDENQVPSSGSEFGPEWYQGGNNVPKANKADFWSDDDEPYNIFRRKKQQGGYIPKAQYSAPFTQGRPVTSPFDEPYQKHEFQLKDYSKESPSSIVGRNNPNSGIPYHGQNLYGTHDPSFSLNYSEGRMPNMGVSNNFQDAVNKPLTFDPNKPVLNDSSITGVPNPKSDSTVTGSKGTGKYTFTPGEWTQFAGTMMPAFYNLAQSMRKPHKFKEFQNPYDGRYLSNLASQYLPYDDSRIVAAQNRVMKSAQQQAPNFQTAQAYQMAGMSGLNREQKDYQMKNEMANQEYASKYNQAAHNVNAAQQAIKAGAHEATRLAQAASNQLQHKAMTQFGMGIHDLGKLMVNREMNQMEMSLMGQIYQQYGLAPLEAVLNGQASWDDVVRFNKDPAAMAKFLQGVDKAHAQNRQQQTTTNSDNGINTEVTTTTAGGYGRSGAGNGLGSLQRGGRVFNLKGINNINKYR